MWGGKQNRNKVERISEQILFSNIFFYKTKQKRKDFIGHRVLFGKKWGGFQNRVSSGNLGMKSFL
jgi:hypothetical protein